MLVKNTGVTNTQLMENFYRTLRTSPIEEYKVMKEIEAGSGDGDVDELLDYSQIRFYDNLKNMFKEFKSVGISRFEIEFRYFRVGVKESGEADYLAYLLRKISSEVGVTINIKFKKIQARSLELT